MPKKKHSTTSNKSTRVQVGNISDISGTINIAGGNITTQHTSTGLSAAEIKQLFEGMYAEIEAHPKASTADKADIKAEVKEIQTTLTVAVQKNEKVDEGFLSRRFRNIARMAPDILDVLVKTLASPALGIEELVKKIAKKAKEEVKAE